MSNNSNNLWQDFLGKDSSAWPMKSSFILKQIAPIRLKKLVGVIYMISSIKEKR